MLRISVAKRPGSATVALEGRLAGPWVDELARCWTGVTALRDARLVRVDLEAVTFIDAAGKELLLAMSQQGAALVASGCMTRAILDEIGTRSRPRRRGARRDDGGR